MIRFFKLNDPYRLLAIFVLLLATRLATLWLDFPYLKLHQESEAIGAFINDGGMVLEDSFQTNAGPLYGYFYGLLTFISEHTVVISTILSAVFVIIQAFVINTIFIRLAAYHDNTYLPALIYALLMSTSPEFMMLSPEMVSITFVLIAFNYLLTHLKYRGTEENIISTGFTFGLAALFAKPAFFFLPFGILIYLLYSSTLNRRYFLFSFGFGLPFILGWLFFLWNDQGAAFWSGYMSQLIHLEGAGLMAHEQLLMWAGFPLLLSLIAAAQRFTGIGMTNNQIQIQRTMLWLGVFGIFFYLISAHGSFSEFIWLMPAMTYFIVLLINSIQKAWMSEAIAQVLFWGGLYVTFMPLIDESLVLLDLSGLK